MYLVQPIASSTRYCSPAAIMQPARHSACALARRSSDRAPAPRFLRDWLLAQGAVERDQPGAQAHRKLRSEEHTSELQSQSNIVCRLLLEKKKKFRPLC